MPARGSQGAAVLAPFDEDAGGAQGRRGGGTEEAHRVGDVEGAVLIAIAGNLQAAEHRWLVGCQARDFIPAQSIVANKQLIQASAEKRVRRLLTFVEIVQRRVEAGGRYRPKAYRACRSALLIRSGEHTGGTRERLDPTAVLQSGRTASAKRLRPTPAIRASTGSRPAARRLRPRRPARRSRARRKSRVAPLPVNESFMPQPRRPGRLLRDRAVSIVLLVALEGGRHVLLITSDLYFCSTVTLTIFPVKAFVFCL